MNMKNIRRHIFTVLTFGLIYTASSSTVLAYIPILSKQVNPVTSFKSDYEFLNRLWAHNKEELEYFLSPYILVVDKSRSKMHLYFYNGETQYIKSYNVLTGKKQGDKLNVGR